MKNCIPFMFLGRSGLKAEIKIHNTKSSEVKTVFDEFDLSDDELRAYRECLSTFSVTKVGDIIAEPIK